MATRIRTIDFLPEIFKTDSNNQFLNATLDQLTQTPKFTKVQGYVGSKFGYGVQANDGYVSEPNKIRTDYQLEPAVIFKKTDTNIAIDAMTYPGLLAALNIEGAITNDHERLFNNEFYSWDSFADLDKLINYSQYYWLPQGPDPITITTDVVYRSGDFTVEHTDDLVYDFKSKLITLPLGNPVITLVRGGRYTFNINQDSPFYIQTEPGLSGTRLTAPNISTRDIYGLDVNGLALGTVTFDVPVATAQDANNYPGDNSVDLVTTLQFEDIHGKKLSEVESIDGVSTSLEGKRILFYKIKAGSTAYIGDLFDEYNYDIDNPNGVTPLVIEVTNTTVTTNKITCVSTLGFNINASVYFTGIPFGGIEENKNYYITSIDGNEFTISETLSGDPITLTNDSTNANGKFYIRVNEGGLDEGTFTNINDNFYTISYVGDSLDPTIKLSEDGIIPNDEKITALFGTQYNTRSFVRNSYGDISLVPIITANLDTLYYQDAINADQFGTIKLIDQPNNVLIDIEKDILGKKTYKSPTNVVFTNGLKIKFDGNITPIRYKTDQYYVEGIGTDEGIKLLPVSEQLVPEPYGQGFVNPFDITAYDTDPYGNALLVPYESDYITINRNSKSKNAWSRSNRWFHIDVLELTLSRNDNSPLVLDALKNATATRAKRPIIEFYPNIKLFNSGSIGKVPVDYVDFTTTDSLTMVAGQYVSSIDLNNYKPDGATSGLFNGARIVFANDADVNIRNKVFVVNIVQLNVNDMPVITLSKAYDGDVIYNDQVVVVKGEQYQGKTFWFDGQYWSLGQQKTTVNQSPKFDIFDENNISFSNTEYYPSTDFLGSTLFQYELGSGPNDSILGLPIKYSSISNIGDLSFQISLNTETFNFVYNNESINAAVNNGFVHIYNDHTNYQRLIGWQTALESSFQYQVFNLIFDGKIICDVAANPASETIYPSIIVYVDNQRVDTSLYTATIGTKSTEIILTSPPTVGTPIEILIHSSQVSEIGYYQIPSNFDHNPFNTPVTSINLGDLRGHYKSICNNITTLTGEAFGRNNFRDLGNLVPYGTRIIQNSSTLLLASIFLRSGNNNFFKGLTHSSNEYIKYKALLADTVNKSDYSPLQSSADILDDVIDQITTTKLNSTAFFWSDMLPTTGRHTTKTYTFKSGLSSSVYPLANAYDFTYANYQSVLVYLTRIIDGNIRTIQLIKDTDYVITESLLTVTKDLIPNDVLKVVEYEQTYGSYVPNTPTKMGLYPKFIPEVIYDTSYITPTYFIKGHDGSLTKLYGEYNDGYLEDFRDRILLEFETRIYNNMKVTAKIPLEYDDIFPGQFRTTDYTREEIQQMYSTQFLNWVGLNRINYTEQQYLSTNEFTWNYNQSKNKLDNATIPQGHWRGIYLWLYDTSTPDSTPWEMLGLSNKPSWWDSYYGQAPYTSDNLLLWTDISNGYIYNNGNGYINQKRVRPNLLEILPVDSAGKLVSPFASVVNSYNQSTFSNLWNVGDVGPAEYSYLKSSTWPFDLMRLFALTKPGQFFTLASDLDEYRYNYEFNQYLTNGRFRGSPDQLVIYGSNELGASHSYFTWIVDYANQTGIDGAQLVTSYFANTDVRLTYRMAGFSDKEFLRFFAEKGSPNSTNNSLLIPDESYSILLYKNEPYVSITYSSIIIQKSKNGYTVYGNSQEKAFFVFNSPKLNGLYKTVSISNITLQIPTQFNNDDKIIPYGYEFTTLYDLAVFIKGYGNNLENQGVKFNSIENSIELNWDQMIAELIYWVGSGWEEGSTVNLNPTANSITIENNYGAVETLTSNSNNFILNQNLVPIQIKDLGINRLDTTFSAKVLNSGDTISFVHARISTTEHLVVFDNVTVFNDTMFNLVTGLRQQRLYVKGNKTSDWNGTLNAPGFIINQDNVLDWQENLKYNKGTIVKYKNEYWVADRVSIAPSSTFDVTKWKKTLYNTVSKGLLPNPSTKAYESTLLYDSNNANLKSDADLLSFSLIGYRPRKYFSQANLDDITQINLYKSLIKNKGTRNSFDVLVGANLQKTRLDYEFHENWAIKRNEYGGIFNKNFIELTLDQSLLTGNPAVVGIEEGETVTGLQQVVQLHDLKNYSYAIQNLNILPTIPSTTDSKLPSAGYVNIDDIRYTGYYITSLSSSDIPSLYKNDYIWIADKIGEWKVYTPVIINARLLTVRNNLNNTCTFIFDAPHTLSVNDPFGIINFDTRVNGYYVVSSVSDAKSIVASLVLNPATTSITGQGIIFELVNQRVSVAKDILDLPLLNADYVKNKVWVDKNPDGEWNVLHKTNNYAHTEFTKPNVTTEFGSSLAYIDNFGYFVSDAAAGKLYNYLESDKNDSGYALSRTITKYPGFGTSMVRQGDILIVSQPDPFGELSQIYIYKMVSSDRVYAIVEEQVLSIAGFRIGDAMALSGDGMYLYTSIIDLNAVLLFQRDDDYAYYDIGLYLSDAISPNATQFTCYGDVRTTALEGRLISFTNTMYSNTFTIITCSYSSTTNKTTIYITKPVPYSVPSNSVVFRAVVNFRTVGALTSEGLATGTDMFSYSLATNYDGTKLFVGSPMSDFSVPWNLTDQGYAFMFDRLVENWEVVGDSPPDAFALFFMPWTPTTGSAVYINSVRLHPNFYVLINNLLIIGPILKSGDVVTVSSGNLVLVQELSSYDTLEDIVPGQRFGWSLDTNKYGTELIVGSPYDHDKDNVEGRVYRFTNEGKRYGRITGILQCHLVEPASILINGYRVALPDPNESTPGDAIYVAGKINDAVITNVFAYATEDGRLIIRLRDTNLGPVNNKLNISVFNGNVLAELGMVGYIKTQVINDPHKDTRSQFGYAVKFNEYNSFVVGAPVANRYLGTTFDFSDDENNHNDCVFDNNFTVFEDIDTNAGAVYMYDYIQSYGESLLTGGNYVYAQSLPDTVREYGKEPKYGQTLEFRNNVVMVGAPLYKTGTVNGRVVLYKNSTGTENWSLFRESNPVVDITKIQKVQLYNNITDSNLLSLDYFDPLQGKLLGPIAENIDFISGVDPAGYNNTTANKGSIVWGKNDIGTIWFDTTYTKFMNYHQSDISYNSKYWGNIFPGSVVTVYSWVESDVMPSFYVGSGIPYDFGKYSIAFETDAGDNLIARYYYWVRQTGTLFTDRNKTLTDIVIEQYITNPQNSGIAYFAPLANNIYALYNAGDSIYSQQTNLHLGYSTNDVDIPGHQEYQLIRTDYPDDFLHGIPDGVNYLKPEGLYNKLLNSFAGEDEFGAIVPNPYLPKLYQIGVGVRPNQGLFVDRFTALKNYLGYANILLKNYPIAEQSTLTLLHTYDETFDTTKYWQHVYWWAEGYSNLTKTITEVPKYYNLSLLRPKEGLIVGVTSNSQGNREVYKYTNGEWVRIGLENGTIEFLSNIWDYQTNKTGFGDNFFDTVNFDSFPSKETRYIIRALNEQIYIGDLYKYRNKSLILMFEYIQSENIASHNYLPWLNKTSLADVSYKIRELLPFQKYQSDNLGLLEGYLNEVKPYHTVLKEFYFNYVGSENYQGSISDFDLPAIYNSKFNKFVSPKLLYNNVVPGSYDELAINDTAWTNSTEHSNWYSNFGLKLQSKPNQLVAILVRYTTNVSQELYVDNAHGLPVQGLIKIDDELISYTQVDRERGKLYGLSRGVNNTAIAAHLPNTNVYSDLDGVIILDTARGYVDRPIVTAYIDTTIYPTPRREAVLQAVMSGDRVVSINVIDPGEGYAVTPEIVFQSSFDVNFTEEEMNFTSSLLVLILDNDLTTGDLIKVTSNGNNLYEAIIPGYYYVSVLGFNRQNQSALFISKPVVTLHYTYRDAISIQHRVIFKPNTNNVLLNYKLSMVPRALAFTSNAKVREISTVIRMDRTSYNSQIQPWSAGIFWPSPFNSLGNDSSTGTGMSDGIEYEFLPEDDGALYSISSATGVPIKFVVYNETLVGIYAATLTTTGIGYAVNDTITILGENLDGVTPANNCTIIVTQVSTNGAITRFTVTGTPLSTSVTLASFQGAVIPLITKELDNVDQGTIVTVSYANTPYMNPSLRPGQIKGLRMYFYRLLEPYIYDDTAAGGALIKIYRPRFTPNAVTAQYYMKIVDPGNIYNDDDQIIIRGGLLGGADIKNDAVINIRFGGGNSAGPIQVATISGIPNAPIGFYYVMPISATQLKVYIDSSLLQPALYDDFIFDGLGANTQEYKDYVYIPEPLFSGGGYKYVASAIVSYNDNVYRCIESNSDEVFDYAKWKLVQPSDRSLNALDRVIGYYKPTSDMPPKELSQLFKGITYPNNIYYGNSFAPDEELPLDFEVKDQPFYPRDISIKAVYHNYNDVEEIHEYIAIGETAKNSVALISEDGETWSTIKLSDQLLDVTDITYSGTYFIISTTNINTPVLLSVNRVDWLTVGADTSYDFTAYDYTGYDVLSLQAPKDKLYATLYVNNTFFGVGNDILRSTDGITWEAVYTFGSQLPNQIKSIAYVDIRNFVGYLAVGNGYSVISDGDTAAPNIDYAARLITSLDGITWTKFEVPFSASGMNIVLSSSSIIVVSGENGEIWYSTNASNWIQATSPVTDTIRDGYYANGLFVLVGGDTNGTILKSANGMTWTDVSSGSSVLNGITHDGTYFYAVGDSGSMLRSTNGNMWVDISFIQTEDPQFEIKGSDFLYGYGPEELTPAIVNDSFSLRVTSLPGAWWDNDTITQNFLYKYTGFNMASKVVKDSDIIDLEISFDGLVLNPAQLSVYILNAGSSTQGHRIYEDITTPSNTVSYSVNWISKIITLSDPIDAGASLLIEVYEIGNGRQLARSNTQLVPMTLDENTGNSVIVFSGIRYQYLETPLVYHNGTRLVFQTDYDVVDNGKGYLQLLFNTVYDPEVDYITYAILADSTTDFNNYHYGYTIPETETFVYDSTNVFTLSNYIGPDNFDIEESLIGPIATHSGNEDNMIVEINGHRLNHTDYSINLTTNELTITASLGIDDLIAVTTFNDTKRQFFKTDTSTTMRTYNIDSFLVFTKDNISLLLTENAGFVPGDTVCILSTIEEIDPANTYTVTFGTTDVIGPTTYYRYELSADNSGYPESYNNYEGDAYITLATKSLSVTQSFKNFERTGNTTHFTPEFAKRSMVSIDGKKVDPDKIRSVIDYILDTNSNTYIPIHTYIYLVTPIGAGQNVIVTSMCANSTPNETSYTITVDKNGKGTIYGTNITDRSWFTTDLTLYDDIIYVTDVSMVTGDKNIVEINGEKIRYTTVDTVANTLSGLTRGVQGTGPLEVHATNSYIYGVSSKNTLPQTYYDEVWNSKNYSTRGDPLQLTVSDPVAFLKLGVI